MFKMTKLHRPVPSLSMAAAIVAATLAAGCGADDSPTAPDTVTDTGLVSLREAPRERVPNRINVDVHPIFDDTDGAETVILPFAFHKISDVRVQRVGKRQLRAGFEASTMVTVECNTSGGILCPQPGENEAHLQQFFNIFFLFGGGKSARAGRINGRTQIVFSPDPTGIAEVTFGGLMRGSFSCEDGRPCHAQMQVKAKAARGCRLGGDLAGTFEVVSDPGVGVIWKRLGSPSGWAMPCAP